MSRGLRHRFRDGLLGDGVEDDATDRFVLDRLFLVQNFQNVPGNRLALAIGVGRENQRVGRFHRRRDIVQPLVGCGVDAQDMAKSSSGRTEPSLAGRSRTWPNEARTL
jgi:hypothetical protein